MNYAIKATSIAKKEGTLHLKKVLVPFGISKETEETLSSPADIYLSALASCILKNIERFSGMMKFQYEKATVDITATHFTKPARLENIAYTVTLISKDDKINCSLLKRNLEKFGTIYNMVAKATQISGEIILKKS